jgi:hypothetical protein
MPNSNPAGTVGKKTHKRRERSAKSNVSRPQPTTPIQVSAVTAVGSTLTVTFDQPIMLKGTPKYATDIAAATPVSATKTGPTTIAILFSASIAAANECTIPYEEPNVRNASGGFVCTSTFPV